MTEDERQGLLGTVAEANAGLAEVAFKLRRELMPKAPALKAAIKAEQEAFPGCLREGAKSYAKRFALPVGRYLASGILRSG